MMCEGKQDVWLWLNGVRTSKQGSSISYQISCQFSGPCSRLSWCGRDGRMLRLCLGEEVETMLV